MRLRPGKLYRTRRYKTYNFTEPPDLHLYTTESPPWVDVESNSLVLFLGKGKHFSRRELNEKGYSYMLAYATYRFLVGERVLIFRKCYHEILASNFEEIKTGKTK